MDIIYKIHSFFVNAVYASSLGEELSTQLESLGEEGGAIKPESAGEEWVVEKLVQIALKNKAKLYS